MTLFTIYLTDGVTMSMPDSDICLMIVYSILEMIIDNEPLAGYPFIEFVTIRQKLPFVYLTGERTELIVSNVISDVQYL